MQKVKPPERLEPGSVKRRMNWIPGPLRCADSGAAAIEAHYFKFGPISMTPDADRALISAHLLTAFGSVGTLFQMSAVGGLMALSLRLETTPSYPASRDISVQPRCDVVHRSRVSLILGSWYCLE